MKPQYRSRIEKILLVAAFAAVLVGCQSTPDLIPELEQARTLVRQVESAPDAGRYAADEVSAANDALRRAERIADDGGSTDAVRDAAYLARRNAEIAQQQIQRRQAEVAMQSAEAERQRVLSQAREREAAAREQQAAVQAQEAQAARQQAEQTAEQARREAALLQEQLRELEARQTDRGLVLTLGDVLFDTGKATLKPGAMGSIRRLAEFLGQTPGRSVTIEGHTDSVGEEAFNQTLSENRANAVRSELLSRGIDASRIVAVGKGESVPVATNDTAAGRQQNRRVEIIISNPTGSGQPSSPSPSAASTPSPR